MTEVLYAEAGMRIQRIRIQRGYSRDMVAELTALSAKFIYEIENGKKGFSASALLKIAEALDVTCDYILTGNHVKGTINKNLLETIELFDEGQSNNLAQILKIVYDISLC